MNSRTMFIILIIATSVLMFTTMNRNEPYNRESNVFDMMNFFPLSIILGTPLLLFGSMIYYVMKDNGRNACLITSSIFVAGFVSVTSTLFMPVGSEVFGFAIGLLLYGLFAGNRIYKDLKEKKYL